MAWNWTLPDWPEFRYNASALEPFEQTFLLSSGEILGAVHHVSQPEREQLRIELLSEEAMQTLWNQVRDHLDNFARGEPSNVVT